MLPSDVVKFRFCMPCDVFVLSLGVWGFPRCGAGGGGAHVGAGGAGDGLPDDSPAGGSTAG